MKAKIFPCSFDIEQYDTNDFICLIECNTIVAYDVMNSQFKMIHNKLSPIANEHGYVQDFCKTGLAGYLFYYRPEDFEKDKVDKVLEQLHNAKIANE